MAIVDILLPVKNGADFLAESLYSILGQTIQDWRLLVLDHGSTDGSYELASACAESDARVQVYSFPNAKGLAGLLNEGLGLCDCKYVVRHDADDVALPDRLEVTLAAFGEMPGCVAIGGQMETIDATGRHVDDTTRPTGKLRVSVSSMFCNPIAHPTVAIRFDAIARMGMRYGVDFTGALKDEAIEVEGLVEDYFMFGQLAMAQLIDNLPVKLIRYRQHGANVSKTRFLDQMEDSLKVSRFLVKSFCTRHSVRYFDPSPFCNHGGMLFDFAGKKNFDPEFEVMQNSLRTALGNSPELDRELAYRKVIADKNVAVLLWRYAKFRVAHQPEMDEWPAVRSWALRSVRGKRNIVGLADRLPT